MFLRLLTIFGVKKVIMLVIYLSQKSCQDFYMLRGNLEKSHSLKNFFCLKTYCNIFPSRFSSKISKINTITQLMQSRSHF